VNSPQIVNLTGTGSVLAGSKSLNFGNVPLESVSGAQSITVTNSTSNAVSIQNISITGYQDFGEFSQTNTCGSSVPAKGNCTIQVTFTPVHLGLASVPVVRVDFNSADSPLTVALSGTGVAAGVNPIPFITQLTPAAIPAGSAGATVTVLGAGFRAGAVVNWNGSGRPTTYISPTTLSVAIQGSDLSAATTATVTVFNPVPGGGTSVPVLMPVTPAATWMAAETDWASGTNPAGVVSADFNRDGHPDLAVANQGDNSVLILQGVGDGTFSPGTRLTTGDQPTGILAADFNGDGIPDLAVVNLSDSTIQIFLGDGFGGFTPLPQQVRSVNPVAIAAADMNGDGRMDLVVANYSINTISVFLGQGNGTFLMTSTPSFTFSGPVSIALADFNGDGVLDVAVANQKAGTVMVLTGVGDGTFNKTALTVQAPGSPSVLGTADFNQDGRTDLAVLCTATNMLEVFSGNGDGTFQAGVSYQAAAGPNGIAFGDMNGDGVLDVVTSNGSSRSVSVFLGIAGGGFLPRADYPLTTAPASLLLADFKLSGILDVATTQSQSTGVAILGQ
jgi:hypothetical protein